MNYNYTHLHVHSEYSLLESYFPVDEIINTTKRLKMKAVAITDINNMFAAIEFYKKAVRNNIKPIIGMELTVKINENLHNIVLLAKNNDGYRNLCNLSSIANFKTFDKDEIYCDFEKFREYSNGLIVLSGAARGIVDPYIINGDENTLKENLNSFKKIFGNDFYLQLENHGLKEDKFVIDKIISISKEFSISTVATNNVLYPEKKDHYIRDCLLCIKNNQKITDEKTDKLKTKEYYFKTSDEMEALFINYTKALENTEKIANECSVAIEFHKPHLPKFKLEGIDHKNYLKKMVKKGLESRYKALDETILQRAKKEIEIIVKMGFTDYFLIVSDFICYARKNGIPVGPGRGSAAGSLVSYALGITNIDPLKYDLLFERFLNPERISMPDIDIDFCYERRFEVVDYVTKLYGKKHVCQIITFDRMQARNAIRNIGRVLDLKLSKVDKIAKLIPSIKDITISDALKMEKQLLSLYEKDLEVKRLLDTSKKIESMPKNISIHAAGVVITDEQLMDIVPLTVSSNQIVTQYNMDNLEELGLLKMDFLGLRTLTVIKHCIDQIKMNRGIEVDINKIDENDRNILSLFNTGETVGIFQFESMGMRNFLKKLKPTRFEDLLVANSLFRPGPKNEINRYIENKISPERIQYADARLIPILKSTYGIIVYQEQVMQIVQKLAGYTPGQADILRRAMSKKDMQSMLINKKQFIEGVLDSKGDVLIKGCLRNNVKREVAEYIFDLMMEFANYAFNKSHSVAYSQVAIQTAYLKYYFPEYYMSSLISTVMGDSAKVLLYVNEIKRLGIPLLKPDINKSYAEFTTENKSIRFGLGAIKNVGYQLINDLVKIRKVKEFRSFDDFLDRMSSESQLNLNKKALESLIKAGVFDSLGHKRSRLMAIYDKSLKQYQQENKYSTVGQINLFSSYQNEDKSNIKLNIEEYPAKIKLALEKEVLGFYISENPLEIYESFLRKHSVINIDNLKNLNRHNKRNFSGKIVNIAGIVDNVNIKYTKNSNLIAFLSINYNNQIVDVTAFNQVYNKYKKELSENNLVLLKCKCSLNYDQLNFECIDVTNLEELDVRILYVRLNKSMYNSFKCDIINNSGNTDVIIKFQDTNQILKMKDRYRINPSDEFISYLNDKYGKENIKLK